MTARDQINTAQPQGVSENTTASAMIAGLTISAIMIVALIITQLGRPDAAPAVANMPGAAQAGMVAVGDDYSLMTAQGPSTSYELVYVMHNRTGNLLVYEYAQPGRLVPAAQRFEVSAVIDRIMRGRDDGN
ncbi:MAG: hypothetical protein ACOC0P_07245 [Planctomycetota bacterium]